MNAERAEIAYDRKRLADHTILYEASLNLFQRKFNSKGSTTTNSIIDSDSTVQHLG